MTNQILEYFQEPLIQSLQSAKTPVVKNALFAIYEAVSQTKETQILDTIFKAYIPHILGRWSSEKHFIKKEVENILEIASSYCISDSNLRVVADLAFDKISGLAEAAFMMLCQMIMNIGMELPKFE